MAHAVEALSDAFSAGSEFAWGVSGEVTEKAATFVIGEGNDACFAAVMAVVGRAVGAEGRNGLAHAGGGGVHECRCMIVYK